MTSNLLYELKFMYIRYLFKSSLTPSLTRCDQQVPRLISLLGCGYTSGHPCLQGGVLELPHSLGQGMVPVCLSVLRELRSKRVVYLRLVIVLCRAGCQKSKSSTCASSFV